MSFFRIKNMYPLVWQSTHLDSERSYKKKCPNWKIQLRFRNIHTMRAWITYPVVRDCKPTVLIADFTNVSGEGLSKVGFRIFASFVATKYGRTL